MHVGLVETELLGVTAAAAAVFWHSRPAADRVRATSAADCTAATAASAIVPDAPATGAARAPAADGAEPTTAVASVLYGA